MQLLSGAYWAVQPRLAVCLHPPASSLLQTIGRACPTNVSSFYGSAPPSPAAPPTGCAGDLDSTICLLGMFERTTGVAHSCPANFGAVNGSAITIVPNVTSAATVAPYTAACGALLGIAAPPGFSSAARPAAGVALMLTAGALALAA